VTIEVNEGNSGLLKVLGTGAPAEGRAAARARAHDAKIVEELEPRDARLRRESAAKGREVGRADTQHIDFELAEVGFEVGIVAPPSRSSSVGAGCSGSAAPPRPPASSCCWPACWSERGAEGPRPGVARPRTASDTGCSHSHRGSPSR
jgi:hypothetical protein